MGLALGLVLIAVRAHAADLFHRVSARGVRPKIVEDLPTDRRAEVTMSLWNPNHDFA